MQVLKPIFYDDFQCIGDQCSYTCCKEWPINVDKETYDKYKRMDIPNLKDRILVGIDRNIKMQLTETGNCPFLASSGLCQLILEYGEDILCHTCTTFPRHTKYRHNIIERSLGNGCPVVLQILRKTEPPLSFVLEEDSTYIQAENLCDEELIQCRDTAIDLLQIEDLPLWSRLYLVYSFANKINAQPKEHIRKCIEQFTDPVYLLELYEQINSLPYNMGKKIECLFDLLRLITKNGENCFVYDQYIKEIFKYEGSSEMQDFISQWDNFQSFWNDNLAFYENFCVNNLFCLEITNDKQMFYYNILGMIMELSAIQFTLFVNWILEDKQLTEQAICDITCYYARRIEYCYGDIMQKFISELKTEGWLTGGTIFILIR